MRFSRFFVICSLAWVIGKNSLFKGVSKFCQHQCKFGIPDHVKDIFRLSRPYWSPQNSDFRTTCGQNSFSCQPEHQPQLLLAIIFDKRSKTLDSFKFPYFQFHLNSFFLILSVISNLFLLNLATISHKVTFKINLGGAQRVNFWLVSVDCPSCRRYSCQKHKLLCGLL